MQSLKSLLLIAGASLPLALGGAAHATKYRINTKAKKSSMKEFTVDPTLKPAVDGKAFKKDAQSIKTNRDVLGNGLYEAYKDNIASNIGGNPGGQKAHHVWAHINPMQEIVNAIDGNQKFQGVVYNNRVGQYQYKRHVMYMKGGQLVDKPFSEVKTEHVAWLEGSTGREDDGLQGQMGVVYANLKAGESEPDVVDEKGGGTWTNGYDLQRNAITDDNGTESMQGWSSSTDGLIEHASRDEYSRRVFAFGAATRSMAAGSNGTFGHRRALTILAQKGLLDPSMFKQNQDGSLALNNGTVEFAIKVTAHTVPNTDIKEKLYSGYYDEATKKGTLEAVKKLTDQKAPGPVGPNSDTIYVFTRRAKSLANELTAGNPEFVNPQ